MHDHMIHLMPQGGRYPYSMARYATSNIRAVLRAKGDKFHLRIDDVEQIDRWEEFVIPRDQLAEFVRVTQNQVA